MSYIIRSTSPFVSIKLTEKGREQLAFYLLPYIYNKKKEMKGYKLTNEEFCKSARATHKNKYDYSKVVYINNKQKVIIQCPIHDEFNQEAGSHLKGNGCPKCSGRGLTTHEYILKAKELHGNKYDYSLIDYKGSFKKIRLICPTHGEFEQSSDKHIKGHGCLLCKESKGEKQIRIFLDKLNIKFNQQHKFKKCLDRNQLPFDFYLPEFNTCIEFDGRQHYEPIDRWGGEIGFLDQQKKDKIKNIYCLDNSITLVRISYKENIKDKLNENLCHIL